MKRIFNWGARPTPSSHRNIFRPTVLKLDDRTVPASVTFTGGMMGTGTAWDLGSNWSSGLVPGASDDVMIDGKNPVISQAVTVHSLVIQGGGSLSGGFDITTNDGTLNSGSINLEDATFRINGIFYVQGGGITATGDHANIDVVHVLSVLGALNSQADLNVEATGHLDFDRPASSLTFSKPGGANWDHKELWNAGSVGIFNSATIQATGDNFYLWVRNVGYFKVDSLYAEQQPQVNVSITAKVYNYDGASFVNRYGVTSFHAWDNNGSFTFQNYGRLALYANLSPAAETTSISFKYGDENSAGLLNGNTGKVELYNSATGDTTTDRYVKIRGDVWCIGNGEIAFKDNGYVKVDQTGYSVNFDNTATLTVAVSFTANDSSVWKTDRWIFKTGSTCQLIAAITGSASSYKDFYVIQAQLVISGDFTSWNIGNDLNHKEVTTLPIPLNGMGYDLFTLLIL